MHIKTSDTKLIKSILKKLSLPQPNSHKGQNGKLLIIGGSSLFHAASLWSAEVASHFVDMVHYSSTKENEEIFLSLKKKFRNGMVIKQKDLFDYVKEDDVVLLGTGMVRTGDEGKYTYDLTKSLIEKFSNKRFVIDAGSLQIMEKEWLLKLKQPAIVTPHQKEFEKLFDVPACRQARSVHQSNIEEKTKIVREMAKKYHCVILLKAVVDIISDGEAVDVVEGGNAGLTKGGTGDVLAALTASFYTKNNPFESAVFSSIFLKKTAEVLYQEKGYWYNINDIIEKLPKILKTIVL